MASIIVVARNEPNAPAALLAKFIAKSPMITEIVDLATAAASLAAAQWAPTDGVRWQQYIWKVIYVAKV